MIRVGYRTTGYRSEQFCGEGYRDAASVMAHEVFQLQNCDILDTLSETILKDTQIGTDLVKLSAAIDGGIDDKGINEFLDSAYNDDSIGVHYFGNVLNEIKEKTGKDIKYALWLCDSIDNVKNEYGQIDNLTEFDKYNTSDVVLSDIGKAGRLYGYESNPLSIDSIECNV